MIFELEAWGIKGEIFTRRTQNRREFWFAGGESARRVTESPEGCLGRGQGEQVKEKNSALLNRSFCYRLIIRNRGGCRISRSGIRASNNTGFFAVDCKRGMVYIQCGRSRRQGRE